MSKVTVPIGFYLQGEHYAQMQAFLPRIQAIKIPQLKIQERINRQKELAQKNTKKPSKAGKSQPSKSQKSQSKKGQSEDDGNEQFDEKSMSNLGENYAGEEQQPMMNQDDAIMDQEQRVDSEKEEQNLMKYLEDDDDSEDDDDLDDDDDLSSISRSMSVLRNNPKTKRQKGDTSGLMQLPDKRPRKDKKLDQATEIIRRQQKQRKRKQYLKKQVQAQQKATLDKILNQTGRKLKLRQQKQTKDQKMKQQKSFKSLGDVPKIITIQSKQGHTLMIHNTKLFSEEMTRNPQVRIAPECSECGKNIGRYKIKNSKKVACSLECYKKVVGTVKN